VEEPRHGKDEAHPGGEPAGFIIEVENGFRIYRVGDTGMFADMAIASSTSPHSC
jgi:L-ascorbate metabolism protein UlaG (beta-lactamase superfamily)